MGLTPGTVELTARDGPINARLAPAAPLQNLQTSEAEIQKAIGPALATRSAPKSPALGHSTKKPVSRAKGSASTGKLQVVKSRERGQETWTIKTGKRGEKKPEFRVRLTDSGYRVMLRFYSDDGRRPERYCCYLSVSEWKEAKRQDLAGFAGLIAGKVEARHAAGDLDEVRYQEIAPRLHTLAGND